MAESQSYSFRVEGQPIAMQRPRVTRGRKAYTPQRSMEAEEDVARALADAYGYHQDGVFPTEPVFLVVDYYKDCHVVTFGHNTLLTHVGGLRGDIDNYLKTTMDGMTKGGAWGDDKQVVSIHAQKHPYKLGPADA